MFGSLCATLGSGGGEVDTDTESDSGSSDYDASESSETDADRDLVRTGGRPPVPLARQILVCNRRWQWELPEKGAVSLATQHILQYVLPFTIKQAALYPFSFLATGPLECLLRHASPPPPTAATPPACRSDSTRTVRSAVWGCWRMMLTRCWAAR